MDYDLLDQFADEKVVVLYRGIHFSPNRITPEEMKFLEEPHAVGNGLYSNACYELAGEGLQCTDYSTLREKAEIVADSIKDLETVLHYDYKGWTYPTRRDAFQEVYSNSYDTFHKGLRTRRGLFANLPFTRNPHVSCTELIRHTLQYGYGMKEYGGMVARKPEYDNDGMPRNPILGKLYGIVLDEAAIEELSPYDVYAAHQGNQITISTHFRKDVLSEREIAIPGAIGGDNVVFEMNLGVPILDSEFQEAYEDEFGITKRRFDNMIKNGGKDVLKQIIYPNQAGNLIYKQSLAERIPALFEDALERIGAKKVHFRALS